MPTRPRLAAALLALLAAAALPSRAAAAERAPATLANLQAAHASDVLAQARYAAFAEKADAEGYRQLARLFRASARAEQVRARVHADAIRHLGGEPAAPAAKPPVVKGSRQNLLETLAHENAERLGTYPRYAQQARRDGETDALLGFTLAHAAEAGLTTLYQHALANLAAQRKAREPLHVCSICGHVATGQAPGRCPVCLSAADGFERID